MSGTGDKSCGILWDFVLHALVSLEDFLVYRNTCGCGNWGGLDVVQWSAYYKRADLFVCWFPCHVPGSHD